jgi:transcriptional regulator with XRE-family HTH domain
MSGTEAPKSPTPQGLNRWRLLRYERGETIADVASSSGVSASTLLRLEGTEGYRPSATIAKALAEYYGVSVGELLADSPDRKAAA